MSWNGRWGAYVCDLLHDGLDALERLLTDGGHLVCELRVLAALLVLICLVFFFLDVLEQRDFADLVAVVVDHIAIVIDFESSTVTEITSCEAADDIAVGIAHLTLLVDTQARHGVDAALLLLWLPALGLADDIAVLVVDVAVFIDLVAEQLLDIAFNDAADDGAVRSNDSAVLDHRDALEASEGAFRSGLLAVDKLSTSDDVTFIVPDLALAVDLLADHGGWIALCDAAENSAAGIDDVAGLVDSAASKGAEVDLLLLFLRPGFSMALDVAVLVDNITVFVDSVADETLGITL